MNEKLFGIDRRRTPPAWAQRNVRGRGSRRSATRQCKAAAHRLWPLGRFSSTTPSRISTSLRLASPPLGVLEAAGVGVQLAAARLLRPAADFARASSTRRARSRRGTPTRCSTRHRAARRFSSSSRAACRRCAKTRRRCCAATRSARAQVVGDACMLFEDYLERELAGRTPVPQSRRRDRQRSCCTVIVIRRRWGCVAPAKALLSRIPSCKVVDLDSGCCGMAGSFGYSKDHYEVSQADRRTAAAAGRARAESWGVAGRGRHVLPSPGRAFCRGRGAAPGRHPSLADRIESRDMDTTARRSGLPATTNVLILLCAMYFISYIVRQNVEHRDHRDPARVRPVEHAGRVSSSPPSATRTCCSRSSAA